MRKLLLVAVGVIMLLAHLAQAQVFVVPHLGFKSYSLKGALVNTAGGSTQNLGIGDGGKTSFEFGAGAGYGFFKAGIYSLDVALDFSFSSAGFFEAGYNSAQGPGKFSADGLSGLTTTSLEFNLMPIHRLSIPNFDLISPFGGVGLALNIFSNSNLNVAPSQQLPNGITVKAANNTKLGLIIFYGATAKIGMLQPYLQFKHLIPFGSEFQFTDDPTNVSVVTVKDSPGYFNLSAGVKFDF